MKQTTWPRPEPPAGGTDTPTVWTSWHLHLGSHARSVQDRVLTDLVGPAVGALGDKPWFFIRYWQAGPHLRLRVGDLDPVQSVGVERSLRERLAVVGRLAGGEEPVDRVGYRRDASRLAAVGEQGPDRVVRELLAPGVYRAAYEPEYDRYGGRALMPRTERLFRLSSELVLALMPHVPTLPRRSLMALRATMAAATAIGGAAEQSYFYAHGLRAWRSLAVDYGYPADQIDHLCRPTRGADEERARPVDPGDHGPFLPWHTALTGLVGEIRRTTPTHPGPIVSSHVHMLHNRLGLTMAEELRTYAWLGQAFPVDEGPSQT